MIHLFLLLTNFFYLFISVYKLNSSMKKAQEIMSQLFHFSRSSLLHDKKAPIFKKFKISINKYCRYFAERRQHLTEA